jgi:hypothetical protein
MRSERFNIKLVFDLTLKWERPSDPARTENRFKILDLSSIKKVDLNIKIYTLFTLFFVEINGRGQHSLVFIPSKVRKFVKIMRLCVIHKIRIIIPTKKAEKAVKAQRMQTPGYINSKKLFSLSRNILIVKYQN